MCIYIFSFIFFFFGYFNLLNYHFRMDINPMNHVLSSQKIILQLNKMITSRREEILFGQTNEEKFLRDLLAEVQGLDEELFQLKNFMNQISSPMKESYTMKRRFDQSTVNANIEEAKIESTCNGGIRITKKVKFAGENETSGVEPSSGSKNSNLENSVSEKSNVELYLVRKTEPKNGRIPCPRGRILMICDSQLLRISGAADCNTVNLTMQHPILAFGQSGLKLSQINSDFTKNRLCSCCKPSSVVIGLGLNDIVSGRFHKKLITDVVECLTEKFGDLVTIFIPPFMNRAVYRKHKHHIEDFCAEIHRMNRSYSKVDMIKFREPNEIQFQSYNNQHISWESGFSFWCQVINEILEKLKNDKDPEEMDDSNEISNEDVDKDILDVGINLNNEYNLSEDEEQQMNDLLTNEIIPFDEIKGHFERVKKPKSVHTPNAYFKFNFNFVSAFLSNYEMKADYIFKIWLNVIQNQDSISRFIFCDFSITEDKLKKDFGDLRFILTGEVTNIIGQGTSPDFIILNLQKVEFWSRRTERIPECLLFTSILDPHNTFGSPILSIINVGQYHKCSEHVTFSAKNVRVKSQVGVSVKKTGNRSLGRFDMSDTKAGICATSEFFTYRN